jgi:HK97 family phage major capsid protein
MAMTVEEILEAMRALVAAAEEADQPLSDEDANRYEELERELAVARRSNEIQKRQAAYDAPGRPAVHVAVPQQDDGLERAFTHYLRTGQVNQDIMELRAQGVGVGSEGGFLVPPGFRQKLVERMLAFGGLANEAETLTTDSGNPLEWPTIDDTANSGAIVAEGGSPASGADLVFGQKTLNAHKYMSVGTGGNPLRVSVELLQDAAFDVSGFVAKALGTRIARAQATDWITGNGVGEPEGITNPATDETADVSGTVDFDDLLDTMARLDPDYVANAKFLFNNTTLYAIRGLVDGQSRPLWLPNAESGLTTMPGGILLGHQVVIDQAMPSNTSGTNKFLVFGDLRESYVIRRVKDVQLVVDPYSRASNGQVQFTAWARADGAINNRNSFVILQDA